MKKMNSFFKNLWKDESGQGMVEYALLIVIVIALLTVFKEPLKNAVSSKMGEISGQIGGFSIDSK